MLSNKEKIVFGYISYSIELLNRLLDIFPPLFRNLVLKVMFKKYGANNFIDYGAYFRYPKKIQIGDNCEINRGVHFYPSYKIKNSMIKIGNNVVIAPNVIFYGAGESSTLPRVDVSESIIVEDNVYIGGNSVIRYGVRLGEGSTIAANTVIVTNVEPYSIYAGSPGKKIR